MLKHFTIRDQKSDQTCASSCVAAIVEYMTNKQTSIDEREIHLNATKNLRKPITIEEAIQSAVKLGYVKTYETITEKDPKEILAKVKSAISKNIPVIVGIKNKRTACDHAVVLVDFNTKNFIYANSWGRKWGINGFGKLPFSSVANILELHKKPPYIITGV